LPLSGLITAPALNDFLLGGYNAGVICMPYWMTSSCSLVALCPFFGKQPPPSRDCFSLFSSVTSAPHLSRLFPPPSVTDCAFFPPLRFLSLIQGTVLSNPSAREMTDYYTPFLSTFFTPFLNLSPVEAESSALWARFDSDRKCSWVEQS